jgi:metal-responsive CopG/Arc/MetJ family transcriptional regulator
MKKRDPKYYYQISADERKIPVCVSLSRKDVREIDRAGKKRGFRTRSEFILSVLSKYF